MKYYVFSLLFIAGWWYGSFWSAAISENPPARLIDEPKKNLPITQLISPLNRTDLQKALSGDYDLINRFITTWDQDAQIMEMNGHPDAQRLPRKDYVRALILGRSLVAGGKKPRRLLPQSFTSAYFLIALVNPADILALPAGFRSQSLISPASKIPSTALDFSPYAKESLFELNPTLALVATYSHPGVIQTLDQLKIPRHTVRNIRKIDDIYEEIVEVGQKIGEPVKAELMKLFMQAALLAVENRSKLLPSGSEKPLYISYNNHFSYPAKDTLEGECLRRLKLNQELEYKDAAAWKIPLDRETLLPLGKKKYIISADLAASELILKHPLLSGSSVVFLDASCQEEPSQFLVLAFFDLFHALERTLP